MVMLRKLPLSVQQPCRGTGEVTETALLLT